MSVVSTMVDGVTIAGAVHTPVEADPQLPLLVALHGGTYTSDYFSVAGSPAGSFVSLATQQGFAVMTLDRPCYGGSDALRDEDNTFARQAQMLTAAVANLLPDTGASTVVLVGHSIGGMISLQIASQSPPWRLLGVVSTGMGVVFNSNGNADALASLPLEGVIDLPVEGRDEIMFGPADSYSPQALAQAHQTYAPVPFRELQNAPAWTRSELTRVAGLIDVPVLHMLGEFDALWDASDAARQAFTLLFATDIVDSSCVSGAGHSLDHHLVAEQAHRRQLSFARSLA